MPSTARRHRSPIFARAAELWAAMRGDWSIEVERHYQASLEATNGHMLNARGRARRVQTFDLFTRGPAFRAAYASEELLEHLASHPIPTLAAFERTWYDAHFGGHQ